jgi:hypothetical protein
MLVIRMNNMVMKFNIALFFNMDELMQHQPFGIGSV